MLWISMLGSAASGAGESAPSREGRFADVSEAAGLDFVHTAGAKGELALPEIMGGGAALFDYDGDGDLDAFLTSGIPAHGRAETSAPTNRLFRREDGRFVDATLAAGIRDRGYGMGAAAGDYDNDGDLDLFVTHFGPARLYRNRGDGTFEDATAAAGLRVEGWSASAAFLDYDADGHLDLFVTRYVDHDPQKRCTDSAGRPDYCSPKVFPPLGDLLWRNQGDGTFTDVTRSSGIASGVGAGLGVTALDWNEDGKLDIYVANDGYANHLWTSLGDGTFRDDAVVAGVAYDLHGTPEAGMGVLAADLDADLDFDLFVTNLVQETNTYYRNLGGVRGFADHTGPAGLAAPSLHTTGFGTVAGDFELDGDLDLVVVNGRVTFGRARESSGLAEPWNRFAEPGHVYLNDGMGRFDPDQNVGALSQAAIARGLAVGDVDDDGDLDLLVGDVEGPARLLENRSERRGHWIRLRVVDPRLGGRDAFGARVEVKTADARRVARVAAASSYLSSSDPRVHFGLGRAERVEQIEVLWPDGLRERFGAHEVDRDVVLTRGAGTAVP